MHTKLLSLGNGFVFGLLVVLGPCDETLPPYTEPDEYLFGTVHSYYNLTPTTNSMTVILTVKNLNEETLDDTVSIHGSFEIMSVRDPSVKKTITISAGRLIYARSYNPVTRRLTLDSQDSLVFSATWDFKLDDRGVDVRQNFLTFYQDPICSLRCLARKEEFSVSGSVIIFSGREQVGAMTLFPLCFVSAYVEPKVCLSITTFPPCLEPPTELNGLCFPTFPPDE